MSSFIALFSEIPNHASAIVCTSRLGNLSEQVGVPPGVGSVYGYFEVLGGGYEGVYVVRLANHLRNIPSCEERRDMGSDKRVIERE